MKAKKTIQRIAFLLTFLICMAAFALPAAGAQEPRPTLLVGGMPFGVRFFTDGILIVDYCDVKSNGENKNPAREAGLKPGDCICAIDGQALSTANQLAECIGARGQVEMALSYRRDGQELETKLTPTPCDEDGRLRIGLYVRDSGAGIGTVTFMTRENAFGGLGHGICDGERGALLPLSRGHVMNVVIGGMRRGAVGAPGELKGHFEGEKRGVLLQNTPCGVFGALTDAPPSPVGELPVAYRHEIHDGAVTLWCTLDDNVPTEYKAEICDIHRSAEGNKCFTVKITDRALLDRTGGILQGMSGSPIIQNGKLVGAVTHVLIGDPTTGYGIFIENMLSQMGDLAG